MIRPTTSPSKLNTDLSTALVFKERSSSACTLSHKRAQLQHYEELLQQRALAQRLHTYAIERISEYYLVSEARGKEETRGRKRRQTAQKVVEALTAMLREKEFMYFTNETLDMLVTLKAGLDVKPLQDIFEVCKLLKKYFEMPPSTNMSYARVLHQKMLDFKHKMIPWEDEDVLIEGFKNRILPGQLEMIEETFGSARQ